MPRGARDRRGALFPPPPRERREKRTPMFFWGARLPRKGGEYRGRTFAPWMFVLFRGGSTGSDLDVLEREGLASMVATDR